MDLRFRTTSGNDHRVCKTLGCQPHWNCPHFPPQSVCHESCAAYLASGRGAYLCSTVTSVSADRSCSPVAKASDAMVNRNAPRMALEIPGAVLYSDEKVKRLMCPIRSCRCGSTLP